MHVWRDKEYLRRKETRTAKDDRREIMPHCIVQVRPQSVVKFVQVHYIVGNSEKISKP